MKKTVGILLALVFFSPFCARGDASLSQISAANALDGIFARHTAFTLNTIYYGADGAEVYSTYQAMSLNDGAYAAAFEDSEGYSEFLNGDAVYLFDPSSNAYIIIYFYGDQYQQYIDSYDDYLFVYDNESEIARVKAADGLAIVSVYTQRNDLNGEFFSSLGADTHDAINITYTIDPDTLEVQKYDITAITGSRETKIASAFTSFQDAALTPPDFVTMLQTSAATRTITVVFPDGTSKAYTVSSDALFSMALPPGYEAYADSKRSQFINDSDLSGKDAKIYILPVE